MRTLGQHARIAEREGLNLSEYFAQLRARKASKRRDARPALSVEGPVVQKRYVSKSVPTNAWWDK